MGAIAHILVLIPFFGLIGAGIIWATHKKRSHFVAYQSLQAITYQSISVLTGLALGCATFLLTIYLLFPPTQGTSYTEPSPMFILCLSVFGWLFILTYVVYGVWGGISILRGYNFHYLIIGSRLEQFLELC